MITLPPPATTTELYLAAVLEELRQLRAQLTPPASPALELAELRGIASSPAPVATNRVTSPASPRRR